MVRGLESGQKAALLINEMQRGIAGDLSGLPALSAQIKGRFVLPHIAALAEVFHAKGLPVIHSHVVHRRDFSDMPVNCVLMGHMVKGAKMVDGNEATDAVPELTPREGDFVMKRRGGLTPFYDNHFDTILRTAGVSTLVVTGVSTNIAIPSTCVGAVERGYQVIIPEDCVAGSSPEVQNLIIAEVLRLLATITTSNEVIRALNARAAA